MKHVHSYSLVFGFLLGGCFGGGTEIDEPSDAGRTDMGDDVRVSPDMGGGGCTMDSECDDDLYCTGTETCSDGECQAGSAIVCDDEIACTADACNESTDSCDFVGPDVDGDGAADAACLNAAGDPVGDDCDDSDAARNPDATEVCGGVDDDCDNAVDEGLTCDCPAGFATCDGDPEPGCMTNLASDVDNCGACAAVCGGPHVVGAACAAEVCSATECEVGFADCNGDIQVLNGDGCETTGSCAIGIIGAGEETLLSRGGTGGDAFDEACGSNVLVGIAGQIDGWITQIAAVCAPVAISRNADGYLVQTGAATTLPAHGGVGTSMFASTCPENEAVVGFGGKAGALIDQLELQCAAMTVNDTGGALSVVIGAPHTLEPVGGSGGSTFASQSCDAGQIAVALAGRAGDGLDAITFVCQDATVLYTD